MKKLLPILFILISAKAFCQTDSVVSFSEVVKVDSVSQSELFERARLWVNDNFVSGKDVSQIVDKEDGQITGSGIFKSPIDIHSMGLHHYIGLYTFTFKIFCKDGRYKYIFDNFNNTGFEEFPKYNEHLGLLTSATKCPTKYPLTSQKKMDEVWANAKENLKLREEVFAAGLKTAM